MASSSVLGNDDLLHEIFQYCAKDDIASVRLCCRQFEIIGSPYLFRSLTLGFRKRYMRRLQRITTCGKFSKGVREIVWELASYSPGDMPYAEEDLRWFLVANGDASSADILDKQGVNKSSGLAAIARLNALARDEIVMISKAYRAEFYKDLKALPGLRTVTFTTFSSTHLPLLTKQNILAIGNNMPPPLRALRKPLQERDLLADDRWHLTRSVCAVILALRKANCKITSLRVFPTPNTVLGHNAARHLEIPGLDINFHTFLGTRPAGSRPTHSDTWLWALRNLRSLHLDIGDPDSDGIPDVDGFQHMLSRLPKLESLYVRLRCTEAMYATEDVLPIQSSLGCTALPHLRHIHLHSFWFEAKALCALLDAHGASLESVELSNIAICADFVNEYEDEDEDDDDEDQANLMCPFGSLLDDDPAALEWLSVAETCQGLPRLSGLYIDAPAVSGDWDYLSLFAAEALMEIGMGGRENKLYEGLLAGF